MHLLSAAVATTTALILSFAQVEGFQYPQTYFNHKGTALEQANRLLSKHPLIDTHNDLPMILSVDHKGKINHFNLTHLDSGHTDIERLHKGHLTGQFWSIYYDCDDAKANQLLKAMESIDVTKRMINLYRDTFELVTTTKEFEIAFKRGRISSMMGVEGGQMIENSMAALRTFYDLGVRYMTLTHNCHTPWSESCCDPNPPPFEKGLGLTGFGKKIVHEMNRLGMMVDISHVAHATMHAVLDITKAPVIFSHSSSYTLCSIERNVPDEVLERLHETDGVVMVNFYSGFVQCDHSVEATVLDVADHVEHIAKIAGRHRVGLGADYDGVNTTPRGLEDVSKYPNLFAELIKRGWSNHDLIALAGKNFLRVWERVEHVRDRLSKELPEESLLEEQDLSL